MDEHFNIEDRRLFQNCPRCNSRQRFAQNKEYTEDGVFRIFTECNKCRKQFFIKLTTTQLEKLEKRRKKLKNRRAAQLTADITRSLTRLDVGIHKLDREIAAEKKKHNLV